MQHPITHAAADPTQTNGTPTRTANPADAYP
jgi:hypothetical protein